jgi:ATP-dependent Clp protease ATP-binding subunit ClpA
MDSATLTDNTGFKANFSNVILVMTSNIGASERTVMGFNADSSISRHEAMKSFFTPEFRNRLDGIVEFGTLPMNVVEGIVDKFIHELNTQLKSKKVMLTLTDKAKAYIAKIGYDKAMGARPLGRVISDKIKDPLVDEMLFGRLVSGGKVLVDYTDQLIFDYAV